MATARKISVGSGRLQKFGSTPIAIPSQNFDTTLAGSFGFYWAPSLAAKRCCKATCKRALRRCEENGRFYFSIPITVPVKFLTD